VVDETADLALAARNIIFGATLDNNILCIAEKEILVVASVADQFIQELKKAGCYWLSPEQVRQLEPMVASPDGTVNRDLVGRNANVILAKIGVKAPDSLRMISCEVPFDHPFVQHELLMPVIPMVRVRNVDEAIELAVKAEHGFGHTATMHSRNIDNLHRMARAINTSIFIKNGPSCAGLGFGGEGYTTMSIASPTGEGITNALTFTRERRCVLVDVFRIV
jgi:acyl-CoA reductase-like NAD-dependent aldehyde dehydrogenase